MVVTLQTLEHSYKENTMLDKKPKKPKKLVTIFVDGTPHEVEKDKISYSEIVTLAYPDYPQNPQITYSVTYERGHGGKEGVLAVGGTVKVKEGMKFDVSRTGES